MHNYQHTDEQVHIHTEIRTQYKKLKEMSFTILKIIFPENSIRIDLSCRGFYRIQIWDVHYEPVYTNDVPNSRSSNLF